METNTDNVRSADHLTDEQILELRAQVDRAADRAIVGLTCLSPLEKQLVLA